MRGRNASILFGASNIVSHFCAHVCSPSERASLQVEGRLGDSYAHHHGKGSDRAVRRSEPGRIYDPLNVATIVTPAHTASARPSSDVAAFERPPPAVPP